MNELSSRAACLLWLFACLCACSRSEAQSSVPAGPSHGESLLMSEAERQQALPALEAGCNAGQPIECLNLGLLWLRGPWGPEVLPRAVSALSRACSLGQPFACDRLASHYLTGLGVPPDPRSASAFFERACALRQSPDCTHPLSTAVVPGYARCAADNDCAVVFHLNCPGPCGYCAAELTPYGVNLGWLAGHQERCRADQEARDASEQEGLRSPDCALCPPPSPEGLKYGVSHAFCRNGQCIPI